MVGKKKANATPKKQARKGRTVVDTVTISVEYKEDDLLKERGVSYLAEELVAKSVSALHDSKLTHRYRMAFRRGKFNTIVRYGIHFLDIEAPYAANGTVEFKFKAAKVRAANKVKGQVDERDL